MPKNDETIITKFEVALTADGTEMRLMTNAAPPCWCRYTTEKVIARLGMTVTPKPPASGDRFLSRDDVVAMTSLCRESIRLRVNDGTFPKPININGRRVAWRESDVQGWMDRTGK